MTSDASKFPPKIAKLFQPRPPPLYIEPIDVPPAQRRNTHIEGIALLLPQLQDYLAQGHEDPEGTQQQQQREKKEKQRQLRQKLLADAKSWDPDSDPQIRGNPYRTLFVGRLAWSVTEVDLQKVFSAYGPIERVRVVRDKSSNEPKGYAFVLFERERDLKAACKEANGKVINGRAIIVDVERGRTVKNWKPRRLGGGIGGRGYSQRPLSERIRDRGGYFQPSYGGKRFSDKEPFRKPYSGGYSRPPDGRDRPSGGRYSGRHEPRERDFFERERDAKSNMSEREREREKFREKRLENERARGKPRAY